MFRGDPYLVSRVCSLSSCKKVYGVQVPEGMMLSRVGLESWSLDRPRTSARVMPDDWMPCEVCERAATFARLQRETVTRLFSYSSPVLVSMKEFQTFP